MMNCKGFTVWLCCGFLAASWMNAQHTLPGNDTESPSTTATMGDFGFSTPGNIAGQVAKLSVPARTATSSLGCLCGNDADCFTGNCGCNRAATACNAGRGGCQSGQGGCYPGHRCGCGTSSTLLSFFRSESCDYHAKHCVRPFGSLMRATMNTQIQNGIAAQMVFHHFHFFIDPHTNAWQLTESGKLQADNIARLTHGAPGQIVVESTGNPTWDLARRQAALAAMEFRGVAVGLENLMVGRPGDIGLSGIDAESAFARRYQPIILRPTRTQSQAIVPSTTTGAGRGGGSN